MRWRDMRGSGNIEDREGAGPARGFGGGAKIGGVGLIAVVVVSLLMGLNPLEVLVGLQGDGPPVTQAPSESPSGSPASRPDPADDPGKDFVARVLGDTEDTWRQLFGRMGGDYRAPRLVLFRGSVDSACGMASCCSTKSAASIRTRSGAFAEAAAIAAAIRSNRTPCSGQT